MPWLRASLFRNDADVYCDLYIIMFALWTAYSILSVKQKVEWRDVEDHRLWASFFYLGFVFSSFPGLHLDGQLTTPRIFLPGSDLLKMTLNDTRSRIPTMLKRSLGICFMCGRSLDGPVDDGNGDEQVFHSVCVQVARSRIRKNIGGIIWSCFVKMYSMVIIKRGERKKGRGG